MELKRIKDKQLFLGALLTDPDKGDRPKPMTCKRFLLQGVATSPGVVYVCRRGKADLIELDEESEEEETWWRLAYNPGDDKDPVTAEVRMNNSCERPRLITDVIPALVAAV